MLKPKIIHVLDDRAAGGVMTAVGALLDSPLQERYYLDLMSVQTALALGQKNAPALFLVHDACNWQRLPTLWQLRRIAPLIIFQHHYSEGFVRSEVRAQGRFKTMMRLAGKLSSRYVAVSLGQQRWLLDQNLVEPHKLRAITACPKPEKFEPLQSLPPPRLGQPLILGAYGRFCRQKGFDLLIAALRQLPPDRFRLKLGGFGPDEAMLRAAAEDCPQVSFCGPVQDVGEFLKDVDVVAVPSRWEPFGLVALEARVASRPLIVSAVDGLPEQAQGCGLGVPSDDLAAWVGAIARLPDEPLADWSAVARQSTVGIWEHRLNQLDRLYQEVLA